MKKDLFVLPNGKEIHSGHGQTPAFTSVTYTQMVNDATDLEYGAACAGMIEAALLDTSGAFSMSAGDELAYYSVAEDGARTLQGYFTLEKPTKPSANTCKFTAYDRMIRFDKDLSMWLASLTEWPYTMGNFLTLVCAQCGVELADGVQLINGDFQILRFIQQVTGRQLIKWIACANAAFAAITPEGKLTFSTYTDVGDLGLAVKSLKLADYTTAPIERVVVKQHEDDVGVAWPQNSEGETYTILGNPLLATLATADLVEYVKSIADLVVGMSYTPAEAQFFDPDGKCKPGTYITITDRYGKKHRTAVFSVKHSGSTSTVKSTGNPSRDSAGAVNGKDAVKVLQGRVAKIRVDLEEVSSDLSKTTIEVGSVKNEQSGIKQTVGGIETRVSNTEETVDGLQSKYTEISQRTDGLDLSVTTIKEEVGEKADQSEVTEITERFRFEADGLTITNSGTGMGIGVSEKRVVFTGGKDPTTVITPNAMETTNLTVGTRLDVGNFSLIPRTNGNLSLRCTGGTQ